MTATTQWFGKENKEKIKTEQSLSFTRIKKLYAIQSRNCARVWIREGVTIFI